MKGTELEQIQSKADGIIAHSINEEQRKVQSDSLAFLLGGIDAVQAIKFNLESALIINIQHIRDARLYLAGGFERFEDFLDRHRHSPMTYRKFNELEGFFKKEGAPLFDILQGSGLSVRQRQSIGKGNVRLEGDKMIVQNGEELMAIDIANKPGWTDVLIALADANADKQRLLDKQAEKQEKLKNENETGKAELEKKQREIDELKENRDPLGLALMGLMESANRLAAEVAKLSESERLERGEDDIHFLMLRYEKVRDAYGLKIAIDDDTIKNIEIRKSIKAKPEMTEEEKKEVKQLDEMTDSEKDEFFARQMAIIDAEGGFEDID